MASINMDLILKQLDDYLGRSTSFKKKSKQVLSDYMLGKTTLNLDNAGNVYTPEEVADEFIRYLYSEITNSGLSSGVVDALTHFAHGEPYELADGTYAIDIYFDGEKHRDSLYPEPSEKARAAGKKAYPDGISDIVALYNNGVDHQMNRVYGKWHGHDTASTTNIPYNGFMHKAKIGFQSNYGKKYGVKDIEVDDRYI